MQKRLYRSTTNKNLAGVCGGLGEYFNIDPVLVRVLFVLTAMMGGPGLIVYIVLALIIPEQPTFEEKVKNTFEE